MKIFVVVVEVFKKMKDKVKLNLSHKFMVLKVSPPLLQNVGVVH